MNEEVPALSGEVPIWVWPSRKVAEPVGVPDPNCGAIDAVNVTLCPLVSCVAEANREVMVAALAGLETVIETAAEVDEEKFASPE